MAFPDRRTADVLLTILLFALVLDRLDGQSACQAAGEGQRCAASLNILVSGLIWRQDHNGFTHQDPGFLDVVANKSPSVVRICLPPDANCLLSVGDHCFRSQNYVNVIVADKQPQDMQYLEWRRRSPTVPRAWASGTGPATTRGRSPTWDWRAAATCRR